MIDCETCIHYEDYSYCEKCEHLDCDLRDHYREASPEIIAKREEETRQRLINQATHYWVECDMSDDFKRLFKVAQKCVANMHFREALMCVHVAEEGFLVASNTRILLELACDVIPEQLKGKNILKLEDDRAAINNNAYPNYKELFKGYALYSTTSYKEFTREEYNDDDKDYYYQGHNPIYLCNSDKKVLINENYLNLMQETLTGQIFVTCYQGIRPLLFAGENGQMLIVPLKPIQL